MFLADKMIVTRVCRVCGIAQRTYSGTLQVCKSCRSKPKSDTLEPAVAPFSARRCAEQIPEAIKSR